MLDGGFGLSQTVGVTVTVLVTVEGGSVRVLGGRVIVTVDGGSVSVVGGRVSVIVDRGQAPWVMVAGGGVTLG